jgi:hypothetical protein
VILLALNWVHVSVGPIKLVQRHHFLLKCLYQARKVSTHVHFLYMHVRVLILELFRQSGIFSFVNLIFNIQCVLYMYIMLYYVLLSLIFVNLSLHSSSKNSNLNSFIVYTCQEILTG